MKKEYLLSINSGFAVNRFTNLQKFSSFVKDFLKIDYLQVTSDFLMLNMNDKYVHIHAEKLAKELNKKKIKINSTFTGAYSRLNHLSHPNKEHQDFWLKWFKRFFKISKNLGANYSGSHLGIIGLDEKNTATKVLKGRLIDNWLLLSEYAYKIGLKGIIWEPMSVTREFGETIFKTKNIQKFLNAKVQNRFFLCLDVAHGDEASKNRANYNPYAWLKEFRSESPVIHLKQKIKNQYNHLPFLDKNNSKVIINNKKVIKILNYGNLNIQELSLELNFKERNTIEKNLKKEVLESVNYWKEVI
jgi:hypothetical protein